MDSDRPWLKYWPRDVPQRMSYSVVALHDRLRDSARKYPWRTAIYYEGVELSYEQLDRASDRVAAALSGLGVVKGDRVALYLPNSPQFVICLYGALKAGAIVVPCNPAYKEAELNYQLKDSGAKILIAFNTLIDIAKRATKDTAVERIIITGYEDVLPAIHLALRDAAIERPGDEGLIKLADLIAESKNGAPDVVIDPREDVAFLCYTGGTTGTPKGVMLTHYNCVVNNTQKIMTWKLKEAGETLLIYLPLSHIYGLNWCLNTGIALAAKIVIQERFSIRETLEAIEKHRVTIFYGVPPVYSALSRYPELKRYDLSSVRIWMSAAAPLLPEVRRQFKMLTGIDVIECWGLTEAAPCLTFTPLGIGEVKPNLIGIPTIDTEVAVVDVESRKRLGPNEVGELVARGPQVMKGYWNKPEETKEALRDGWLRTGDLGFMSEDGLFYFVDRDKDLINVGGFKVWPAEVENTLLTHPAVVDAAVIAERDDYYGEVPKAFVVVRDDYRGKVSEEELIAYCKERLASFKAPKRVVFVDAIPKTPSGKTLRRLLRGG